MRYCVKNAHMVARKKSENKVDVWTSHLQPSCVGLENLGNSCYVNCVLQALFVTKRFTETVLRYEVSKLDQPVLHALQGLFQLMENLENRVVSTSSFLRLTKSQRGQQDSSEYLMALFEILHKEDMKKLSSTPDTNVGSGSSESYEGTNTKENLSIATSSTSVLPEAKSIIQSIFGGKIQTDIKCLECGKSSSQTEFFTELPVFLPEETNESAKQPVEMEELLHSLFVSEKLTDNNRYECQKCQTLQDGIRVQQLASPPENLILILNRFKFNQTTKELQKHMKKVHFSEFLDLPVASNPQSSMKYKLYAVIVHIGNDVGSGHYYTLVCKGNNEWWRMDDERVSRSTMEKLNQLYTSETPYILFYRLVSSDLTQSSPNNPDSTSRGCTSSTEKRANRTNQNDRKEYRLNRRGNSAYKKSLNSMVQFLKDMHKR